MTNAREVALRILTRIEAEHAYTNLLLDAELQKTTFDNERDAGFVTELVYGVIRWQKRLDWFLDQVCKKPMQKTDPALRRLLRLGAYQLLMLDRVPASAAINETVKLAGKLGKESKLPPQVAKNFVNGVLRQLDRQRADLRDPETIGNPVARLAAAHSFPEWMVARWIGRLGEDGAAEYCRKQNQPTPLTVRVNSLKTSKHALAEQLAQRGVTVEELPGNLPGLVMSGAPPTSELEQGLCLAQNASAMLIALIVAPRPGEHILDACAGSGVKTTHLAELMGNHGQITAADLHQGKTQRLLALCKRLGISNAQTFCGDMTTARKLPGMPNAGFDRILVDAPCSGFGVLRKHPEAKWTRQAAQIAELAALQLRLLLNAASLLKTQGGVLVYSACTTEPEENEQVIAEFLKQTNGFRLESPAALLPSDFHAWITPEGFLRIEPPDGHFDGFFGVRLVR
ncbi:sun protein [Candidatus Moduliflexus flocculans]|uniref:16S rRNA (cytosine(967)-C(5))-methyltransferase n=1 Tax=Candidatus Moduliflexus flocculans TaxID=1499966 RepID=A0A081BQ22_9BACT|nr:sun protein [Candidatus Moduliflexus flocculans]